MDIPISVIIPVAPDETDWLELVNSLTLSEGSDIILAGCGNTDAIDGLVKDSRINIRTTSPGSGRASVMNAGANMASNDWLWFLHADSRLAEDTLSGLAACLKSREDRLYFFDLVFRDDGPDAMKLNELAVRIRAGVFKIPFGDQGFLLRKELFKRLGGYREDVAYGEDHMLIWKAHQEGVPVVATGTKLLTSARKYKRGGWWRVTARHVWLTFKQGAPEFLEATRRRAGRLFK